MKKKLEEYNKTEYYPLHMPGHKRRLEGAGLDITEIEGFDDLHHPEGIIKEAQERLAELCGSYRSFWLVNGSTAGNLAAISAVAKPGDRVLIARNSHRSVYHAGAIRQLKLEYVYPLETDFGIQGSIDPEDVRDMLAKNPDTKAVVITSPTYDGVVSDVKAIAEICHEAGIPLVVDAAHGAHFRFHKAFPEDALKAGADLVVESFHKTLTSYTQTAVLHLRSEEYVKAAEVQKYLSIYQSSSPSYILMSSLDECEKLMRNEGEELFQKFVERLKIFYNRIVGLKYVQVIPCDLEEINGIYRKDMSKILISCQGMKGEELYDILLNKYHLQPEMQQGKFVTALMSLMDSDEGFERLYKALSQIDEEQASEIKTDKTEFTGNNLYRIPISKACEIAEAFDDKKELVELSQAENRISAEFIYKYPPGIPVMVPGEIFTSDMIKEMSDAIKNGENIHGLSGDKVWVKFGV